MIPRRQFDDSHFSNRELRLMQALAERFKDDFSKPMVNVTHAERGPWAKIWDSGRGAQDRIPYSLAVEDNDPNCGVVVAADEEYQGIRAAVGLAH